MRRLGNKKDQAVHLEQMCRDRVLRVGATLQWYVTTVPIAAGELALRPFAAESIVIMPGG